MRSWRFSGALWEVKGAFPEPPFSKSTGPLNLKFVRLLIQATMLAILSRQADADKRMKIANHDWRYTAQERATGIPSFPFFGTSRVGSFSGNNLYMVQLFNPHERLRVSLDVVQTSQERRLKHEPMLHGVAADRECGDQEYTQLVFALVFDAWASGQLGLGS